MAAKYWYVAGNGSANWSAAANWYNGPGGTLGTTTVPTASDDVYVNAASGSGTLTMTTGAVCLSLTCTGFTGTIAGATAFTISGALVLASTMTLTYTGTITFNGTSCSITSATKTLLSGVTINVGAANTFSFLDSTTFASTTTLTHTSGTISIPGAYTINLGLYASAGAVARYITSNSSAIINLTGVGTVWSSSGTLWGISTTTYPTINVTNATASSKTFANSATTGPGTGYDFKPSVNVIGAGTGTYTLSGNLLNVTIANTGGATLTFNNSSIYGSLDFGTSNVVWNNTAAITLTLLGDNTNLKLSPNMTITTSPNITVSNPGTDWVYTYSNGKTLTGNMTINGAGVNSGAYSMDTFYLAGSLTLTRGTYTTGAGDAYIGTLSSNNTNARALYIYGDLYFTGVGALSTTSTTGLTVTINNIYIIDSSASAKSLTCNTVFLPGFGLYLAGSGSGSIAVNPSTNGGFNVYVTNTGAAPVSFTTSTVLSLYFMPGTNAVWTNAAAQTLTITKDLSIASSAGTPTLTPAIVLNGINTFSGGVYQSNISLGGKSLVTGACTINDTSGGGFVNFTFTDAFSSNSTLTITAAALVTFNSSLSCSAHTVTSATVVYNGAVVSTSTIAFNNPSSVDIMSSISATTAITLNNASLSCNFYGAINAASITITNTGGTYIRNTCTLSGNFIFTTGYLQFIGTSTITCATFASTGSGTRTLLMGTSNFVLTGIGAVWNLSATNLSLSSNSASITATDTSTNAITFTGASQGYNQVTFNRGASTGSITIGGNNSFVNFIDLGTAAHSLIFSASTTQTIGHFYAMGSAGNIITLTSTTTAVFTLTKSPLGLVSCDYLDISHCVASPSTNTWYAGANSTNNQGVVAAGSGWIFTPPPARKLGSGGVG
jgi:hypothetical protein